MISPYVVEAVGPRTARALFVTGRSFDAVYAEKIGLVSEVAADPAGLAAAQVRITADVMAAAPGAVVEAKALAREVAGRPIDHGLMAETARRLARRRVSEEGREGVAAFIARRKPSWTD